MQTDLVGKKALACLLELPALSPLFVFVAALEQFIEHDDRLRLKVFHSTLHYRVTTWLFILAIGSRQLLSTYLKTFAQNLARAP